MTSLIESNSSLSLAIMPSVSSELSLLALFSTSYASNSIKAGAKPETYPHPGKGCPGHQAGLLKESELLLQRLQEKKEKRSRKLE